MSKKKYFGLGFGRLLFAFVSAVIMTVCGLLFGQEYMEIAISAFSVVMLMYLVEGKRAGCACGVIYCVCYSLICFSKGFYGLMVFNLVVGLPMYIVSLFTWKKHKSGDTVSVRRLSPKSLALVLAGAAAGFGCAYLILMAAASSNAFFDGLTLSLATFGTLLLSLRFVEQWYFNLAANITGLILWIFAALADIANLNFVICTFVFVVSNIMALASWLKMERMQRNS
ncbi:MAG: nicotinamide riboside transporter PnuC [Oscillospiraceae bacterium]|nr:nicotinamide riboside transporter PnuC [Oscillospiraceae bacterium]